MESIPIGININLSGNAKRDVEELARAMDKARQGQAGIGQKYGVNVGRYVPPVSGKPGEFTMQPGRMDVIQAMIKQKADPRERQQFVAYAKLEDYLYGQKKKLVEKQSQDYDKETRDRKRVLFMQDRTASQNMRMMQAFASNPIGMMSPMGLSQTIMAKRSEYLMQADVGRNRVRELQRTGMSFGDARKAAAGEGYQTSMPMLGALMTSPAALAVAGLAAAGAGGVALARWQDSKAQEMYAPFAGGFAREAGRGGWKTQQADAAVNYFGNVSGVPKEIIGQLYSTMRRDEYNRGRGGRFSETLNQTSGLVGVAQMATAAGIDPGLITRMQNLYVGTGGAATWNGRMQFQAMTQAATRYRHGADQQGAAQAATEIAERRLARTFSSGKGVMNQGTDFVNMFSNRLLPYASQMEARMSGAMAGAAGAGTEAERFFLRAFADKDYYSAQQEMERGMTKSNYAAISKQLESEGYRGRGKYMRMKQLGLVETTLQAEYMETDAASIPTSEAEKKNQAKYVLEQAKQKVEGAGAAGDVIRGLDQLFNKVLQEIRAVTGASGPTSSNEGPEMRVRIIDQRGPVATGAGTMAG